MFIYNKMVSPSVLKTKITQNESELEEIITSSYKKFFIYYVIITFILLLLCKPSFIMKNDSVEDEYTISYSKVLLWELILCLPFIFDYIINN